MQRTKRLALISCLAVAAIAGAYFIRQKVLASRAFVLKRAYSDPRYKQLDAQVAKLQEAVKASPTNVQARWNLAGMYQKLNLLDLAREEIREIRKLKPDDFPAAIAVANIDLALHDDKEAEKQYGEITKQWPKAVLGWQGLAALLFRQNRFTECLEAVGKALSVAPKNQETRFILASALIQYARQFPSPEMYAPYVRAARKELLDLLPTWPEPSEIHYRLGVVYNILRDYGKAIDHLDKAVAAQPTRTIFIITLIDASINGGKMSHAREVVAAAHVHGVSTPHLYDREGQLLQTESTPDAKSKAVAAFTKAVAMAPNVSLFREHLGSAYMRAGLIDKARDEFQEAVKLNPERPFGYQQLAAIFTRMGDTARATEAAKMATRMVFNEQQLRHFEQLSAAYPEDVKLHLTIADRYRDLGMQSAARDKYRMVLRIDPGNKRAQEEVDKLIPTVTAANTGS
jgi:tetratricopeptide (TPR) repeat protein